MTVSILGSAPFFFERVGGCLPKVLVEKERILALGSAAVWEAIWRTCLLCQASKKADSPEAVGDWKGMDWGGIEVIRFDQL